MKFLSIRRGFQADHSSTSYEFLAIDKKLTAHDKAAVSKLSSRVRPTDTRAHFFYNGEWSDLPGGWEPLMEKYYDVMAHESYDWWTLAMAFPCDKEQLRELKKCDFAGTDDQGVAIDWKEDRAVVAIHCRLSQDCGYGDADEDGDGENSILDLLKKNRTFLIAGDYRLLRGVRGKYGDGKSAADMPAKSTQRLPGAVKKLLEMMGE
jgi:hypothetical protein